MTTKYGTIANALAICTALFGLAMPASAQDCSVQDPCFQTLFVDHNGEEVHLKYGDTLQLKFDGHNTWLIPSAENWEGAQIKLTPVTKTIKVGLQTKIVTMWQFKMKSTDPGHTPPDGAHSDLLMYRDPLGDDVYIYNAKHSGGGVHGGSAHMND